jgi:hypothetical protein
LVTNSSPTHSTDSLAQVTTTIPLSFIEATYQKDTEKVKLRGKLLQGRQPDLPTMIWLADLVEPVENFEKFFAREDNKIKDVRNVLLLNYRNMGDSDHHDSFAMEVIFISINMLGYIK